MNSKSSRRVIAFGAVLIGALATGLDSRGQTQVLNVGGTELPANLGNPYAAIGVTPGSILGFIYDGLARIDPDGTLQPALAVSWENDGGLVWRFHLREGATFQTGTPVTAEGIAANINYLIAPENAAYPIATEMRSIEQARALDGQIVEIRTRQPDPLLAKRMSLLRLVDFDRWQEIGPDEYARAPIGSGPFMLDSWNRGGAVAFSAFDQSWRASPSFQSLNIFTLKDSIARTQALIADQIDLALGLTPEDGPIIEREGHRVKIHHGNQIMAIGLPNALKEDSPLNDRRVRQAMNYAVNRDAIVEFILGGMFPAASQGAAPANVGFNPEITPYAFDPERARVLLRDAGYENGFDLIIEVLVGMGPSDSLIYQQAAQDLAAVGIRVDLRTTTYPERTRKYFTGEWGDVDGFSILWNNAPYNDTGRALRDFSCLKVNPFFCDETIAAHIEDSNRDMDPESRERKLKTVMADMQTLAPAINLIEYGSVIGYSNRIENIQVRPVGVAYELIELSD